MSPVRFLVAPRNPKTLRVSKLASSERCFLRDLTYSSGLKKSPDRLQKVGKSSIESYPSTTKSTTKIVAIVCSKSLGHLKLMAKISVTLDTRPKKDGSRAVIIAFIHKRYRKQTKLGVCLLPDQWDEVSCKVTSKHPQYKALNLKLKSIIASVEAIIARYVGWDVEADLLAPIKAMLEMLERRLREAVTALIEFSRSVFKEFTITHRETIAEYLADAPNVKDAIHTLKVFARPHLDNRQFEKGSKELDRLTSNFPSVLKDMNRTRGRSVGL